MSNLILGLDTGGTNTDAVLFDAQTKTVIKSAKAFTTHHDLSLGISEALKRLSELTEKDLWPRIKSVNLSTTLATNAIAEGVGNQVGLVMIGFDQNQDNVSALISQLPSVKPVFINGGHDYYGREENTLDEAALYSQIPAIVPTVAAWAISGYFSIKNPEHEVRTAEIISSLSNQPITLGQSLTGELGAVRRAATAALNAGLVLIINRLLDAVKKTMNDLKLTVPLMVVKGDGGLVSEVWARDRPIETVVSGPAAGLIGTKILAQGFLEPGENNLWVLDVGGTTSDLAYLENGRPRTNVNGARVGEWSTMVESVETSTRGLGGDSLVDFSAEGSLVIGPRRVLPLCRLAEKYPDIIRITKSQLAGRLSPDSAARFFLPNLPPGPDLNDDEALICAMLKEQCPYPLADYQQKCLRQNRLFGGLKLLNHPAILVSAFTPTDAMAVLGLFQGGIPEASRLAATIMGQKRGLGPEDFSRRILNKFGQLLAEEVIKQALERDNVKFDKKDLTKEGILGLVLGQNSGKTIGLRPVLTDPIALLGAPAAILAHWTEKFTHGKILVPPSHEVASSVGAAAASVSLIRRVDIVNLPNFSGYRAFLPDCFLDELELEPLINQASKHMDEYMRHLAGLAGTNNCQVNLTRNDRLAYMNDGSKLLLGTSLIFTAEQL